ncbi:MAG: hypothetical protein RLZZ164_467 [Actinomycetota bacterium]
MVWSAPGSVGRSQVAAAIATNLAEAGSRTLLIDADVVAPSQLQIFGFAENHVGLASACRLAAREELDSQSLGSVLLDYQMPKHSLQILPGLHLVSRWPELGFKPMRNLIAIARERFETVVIDVAASLERELVDQRTLAERYGVTHAVLSEATHIVGICNDDPISLARYVWAVQELKQLGHGERLLTLVNRSQTPARARGQLEALLSRLAGTQVAGYMSEDGELFTRASELAVPISLAPRNSPTKQALTAFVRSQLLGLEATGRRLAKLG